MSRERKTVEKGAGRVGMINVRILSSVYGQPAAWQVFVVEYRKI